MQWIVRVGTAVQHNRQGALCPWPCCKARNGCAPAFCSAENGSTFPFAATGDSRGVIPALQAPRLHTMANMIMYVRLKGRPFSDQVCLVVRGAAAFREGTCLSPMRLCDEFCSHAAQACAISPRLHQSGAHGMVGLDHCGGRAHVFAADAEHSPETTSRRRYILSEEIQRRVCRGLYMWVVVRISALNLGCFPVPEALSPFCRLSLV